MTGRSSWVLTPEPVCHAGGKLAAISKCFSLERLHRRDDGFAGDWEQGIVADLSGEHPKPRAGPRSRLIGGPSGAGAGRGHIVAARAISSSGVKLQRRAMLARATTGQPVLWVERSVRPLTAPPSSHLRFDVLAEDAKDDGHG